MRNATVKAYICHFMFRVCEFAQQQTIHRPLPDENGVVRKVFSHEFTSFWEWSSGVLEEVGALRWVPSVHYPITGSARSPFYHQVMTYEECLEADFSAYETFDNYCWVLFTYWHDVGDRVYPHLESPHFYETIALKDDLFSPGDEPDVMVFNEARFNEKCHEPLGKRQRLPARLISVVDAQDDVRSPTAAP